MNTLAATVTLPATRTHYPVPRLIRDGRVAVVLSPSFGAGWSTWNPDETQEFLALDATLAQMVLDNATPEAIVAYVHRVFPPVEDPDSPNDAGKFCMYTAEADSLQVQWVPAGVAFRIHEYDGSESIKLLDSDRVFVA